MGSLHCLPSLGAPCVTGKKEGERKENRKEGRREGEREDTMRGPSIPLFLDAERWCFLAGFFPVLCAIGPGFLLS